MYSSTTLTKRRPCGLIELGFLDFQLSLLLFWFNLFISFPERDLQAHLYQISRFATFCLHDRVMPSPSPSWLTPKRRRTTGNLRTVANGRVSNETARTTSDSGSPKIERPTNLHRPISALPTVGNGMDDGNLFYAYARKVWSNLLRRQQL